MKRSLTAITGICLISIIIFFLLVDMDTVSVNINHTPSALSGIKPTHAQEVQNTLTKMQIRTWTEIPKIKATVKYTEIALKENSTMPSPKPVTVLSSKRQREDKANTTELFLKIPVTHRAIQTVTKEPSMNYTNKITSTVKTLTKNVENVTNRITTIKNVIGNSSKTGNKTSSVKANDDIGVVCPVFLGGLGNLLFEFASSYGIAKSKNMKIVVSSDCLLTKIFKLDIDIRKNMSICHSDHTKHMNESRSSSYDPDILKFNKTSNVRLEYYLQSYKYFDTYSREIRQQLTFKKDIRQKANTIWKKILRRFNITTSSNVTFIGVHVRRGDMVNHTYGYNIATKEYLYKAVGWYKARFKALYFITISNDMKWTRKNMPKNISVAYLKEGNTPAFDMATVSKCDHFISTVGSYSWWCGWLAGGHVTYYKWPAKKGTDVRKCFSKDYSDYFYPEWIGL